MLAEILLCGGRGFVIPSAHYVYTFTLSPVTRGKSHYSHTVTNDRLVMQGCDQLLRKYNNSMTEPERLALIRRRKTFGYRMARSEILRYLKDHNIIAAARILACNPGVWVLLASGVIKLIVANAIIGVSLLKNAAAALKA